MQLEKALLKFNLKLSGNFESLRWEPALKNLMNKLTKKQKYILGAAIGIIIILAIFLILKKPKEEKINLVISPKILEGGLRVILPEGTPGFEDIKVKKIGLDPEILSVEAPGRIIASITSSFSLGERIILFESPDMNTLYNDYIRSKNILYRANRAVIREKDKYANQVATVKDVIEAETEAGIAQAEFSQNEGKLRALGFNPQELSGIAGSQCLLITDIPESQLHAVKKGKKVKIHLTSFPDLQIVGTALAVGDNIDQETRTVKVRVLIQNQNNKFKPGMYGKVEFGDEKISGIIVPLSSIVTVEGKFYVFIREKLNEFVRRRVIPGNTGTDNVEINQGIQPGEEVVITKALFLKGLSFGY